MACNLSGLLVLLLAIFSIMHTADALKCYKCTSYELEMCGDYFNQTEIRRRMIYIHNTGDPQMPREIDCGNEILPYAQINQRAACMKRVETEYGRKKYSRQCLFINRDLPILECPKETPNSHRTLESCDVCDTDLCNAAPYLPSNTNVLALTSLLGAFYLRT